MLALTVALVRLSPFTAMALDRNMDRNIIRMEREIHITIDHTQVVRSVATSELAITAMEAIMVAIMVAATTVAV